MKKILLFLGVCFTSLTFGQIYYSENFTTAQTLATSGWTIFDTDGDGQNWLRTTYGGDGCMGSFSWTSTNGALTPNNYAFTPQINLTGVTGSVRIKYKHASIDSSWDAEKYYVYVTTTPTVAAALATTPVHTQTTMNNINTYTEKTIDISAYAGQNIYICFRHNGSTDQYVVLIDDLVVEKAHPSDADLVQIYTEHINASGNVNIEGQIKNNGMTAITSMELKWSVDGGAENTQTLTGLNIAPAAFYDFTHSIPWAATAGNHSLSVNVSAVNGAPDGDLTNNVKTKAMYIATSTVARKVLYEKFTSSTCAPCATFNNTYFNSHYTTNAANVNLINYQVNWPSTGDPYYNTDTATRVGYYSINSAPTLLVNSYNGTAFNSTTLQNNLNSELARGAYATISATHNVNEGTGDVVISATITPYVTTNLKLQAVVVEKLTEGNATTNGETSFKNVQMKMVPNASGTTISAVAGTPQTISLSTSMSGTFVEELSDLDVILFLQLDDDKTILQSAKSVSTPLSLADNFSNKVMIYPNPTKDILNFDYTEAVDVKVFDSLGKILIEKTNVKSIDLSAFDSGVYMVNVTSDNINQFTKVVKQ